LWYFGNIKVAKIFNEKEPTGQQMVGAPRDKWTISIHTATRGKSGDLDSLSTDVSYLTDGRINSLYQLAISRAVSNLAERLVSISCNRVFKGMNEESREVGRAASD
jgi:hypothetical protein